MHCKEEQPPLAATGESLHAATKAQHNQKYINKNVKTHSFNKKLDIAKEKID